MFRGVIAGSALALLLLGTHNAWDTVTYIVLADAKDTADGPEA
jgi:hypothetical protein